MLLPLYFAFVPRLSLMSIQRNPVVFGSICLEAISVFFKTNLGRNLVPALYDLQQVIWSYYLWILFFKFLVIDFCLLKVEKEKVSVSIQWSTLQALATGKDGPLSQEARTQSTFPCQWQELYYLSHHLLPFTSHPMLHISRELEPEV